MTPRMPQAVIFDMDGVLADTEPLHGKCFIQAFRELGIHTTLERHRQAVTLGGSPVRDYYVRLGGEESTWRRIKQIKDKLITALVETDGVLMPGAVDLLRVLKGASIPTGVATSARRKSLEIVLNRFHLWPYFDAFATKDDVDEEKPDPAVFLLAAERLGARPAACVVVEDSPRGVLAAHRAGMKCIAVPTPSTADGDFSLADVVVDSLEDVNLETLHRLT